jgi:hypothetical protein
MYLNVLDILSVLQRRGGSDEDKETGRQKQKLKSEECRDKTEKDRINKSYHIFLKEKNPENSKSYLIFKVSFN